MEAGGGAAEKRNGVSKSGRGKRRELGVAVIKVHDACIPTVIMKSTLVYN